MKRKRRVPLEQPGMKRCAKCGKLKPLKGGFWRYRDAHQWTHGDAEGYRSPCIDCIKEQREADAERIKRYMREYRASKKAEDPETHDKWKAQARERAKRKRDREKAKNEGEHGRSNGNLDDARQ